ncbi:MAG TPA: hypothetical protein VFE23_21465 [Usitatibacter sp.]|jgi:hypothetical protein|nr:hypothetical protein [Usitatibacter sp.]
MVWADATGFADIAPEPGKVEVIPLLIELKPRKTAAAWAKAVEDLRCVTVPGLYARPPKGLEKTGYCTAHVTRKFFVNVGAEPRLHDWIARFEVALPGSNTPPSMPANGAPPPLDEEAPNASRAAVVATIDDNLAFAHARFRDAGGGARTRVEYFWDQGDTRHAAGPGTLYGRERTRREMNGFMAAAANGTNVDEERAYFLAEYDGVRLRLGHGTHTMDLAAGEEARGLAPDAPRHIWVQFPGRDNWGASPLGAQVIDGLRYIVDRADALAASRWSNQLSPIVVNMPHANLGGPHDGTSILESAIDEMIAQRSSPEADAATLDVVLPAGNNHLSRCHAHFDLMPGATQALEWRVLPDDATPNFMEIWLQSDAAADDVVLSVQAPGAPEPEFSPRRFKRGDVYALRGDRDIVCTVVFLRHAGNGKAPMILVTTAPTSTHRRPAKGEPAPAGIWKVGIRNASKEEPVHIEAWIQRDDPVLGRPRYGRQSHFEDSLYQRFLSPSGRLNEHDHPENAIIKRGGAINGIATGLRPVVVGGFRRDDGRPAPYSGRAHVGDRERYPDASGVTDESLNRRGILAAGTRSASVLSMDGTSVAVAQMARLILEQRKAQLKPAKSRAKTANGGLSHGRTAVEHEAEQQEYEHPQWQPRKLVPTREGKGRVVMPPVVPRRRP